MTRQYLWLYLFIFSLLPMSIYGKEKQTVFPCFNVKNFGFCRIFHRAKQDPKWKEAKLLTDRIWLVRSYAMKESIVSDPVSDRYVITCYGGPIDLVHFFCLAANVCSDKNVWEKRLYEEWVAEGGKENMFSFNYRQPPEAHPDDLPSNALGALFGLELAEKQKDLSFDLEEAFGKFITPLLPVPDSIAKEFSHQEIVMGLPEKPDKKLIEQRYGWFTAVPMVSCKDINKIAIKKYGKPFCRELSHGEDTLAEAGFCLFFYKERPIIIRRLKKYHRK
jgi:hypothetical protein